MAKLDTSRGFGRAVQSAVYRNGISGTKPAIPIDFAALEQAAKKAASTEAFAYLAAGAGSERTMAANRAAFDRWQIWPRILTDVADRDLSISLLGRTRATPFLVSPIGVSEMAHPDADVAIGRAAAALQVPYVLSNQASRPMEEVADAMGDASRWFQLYWSAVPELNRSLVQRAEAAGCEAIVVTLDTHILGWRTRDLDLAYLPFTRGLGIAQYTSDPVFGELVRARIDAASGAKPGVKLTPTTIINGLGIARAGQKSGMLAGGFGEALRSPVPRAAIETFLDVFADPALDWNSIARIREWTSLPILLKGVLHPDDAARAVAEGFDGVVVSNHGGRQIDQAVPTIAALPGVVAAVEGKVPVILDSGVRGGADALIALALGATAVGIGRPYVYGLAVAGATGVSEVIRNHIAELDITVALSGHAAVRDLTPRALRDTREP